MTQAIQLMDFCRDMRNAEDSLWGASLQEGFLGGRILPFSESHNDGRPCAWAKVTVQIFFVDDVPADVPGAVLFPMGLRRVTITDDQRRALGIH